MDPLRGSLLPSTFKTTNCLTFALTFSAARGAGSTATQRKTTLPNPIWKSNKERGDLGFNGNAVLIDSGSYLIIAVMIISVDNMCDLPALSSINASMLRKSQREC